MILARLYYRYKQCINMIGRWWGAFQTGFLQNVVGDRILCTDRSSVTWYTYGGALYKVMTPVVNPRFIFMALKQRPSPPIEVRSAYTIDISGRPIANVTVEVRRFLGPHRDGYATTIFTQRVEDLVRVFGAFDKLIIVTDKKKKLVFFRTMTLAV